LLILSSTRNLAELIEYRFNHDKNEADQYQANYDIVDDDPEHMNDYVENMGETDGAGMAVTDMKRDTALAELDNVGPDYISVHKYEHALVVSEIRDGGFFQEEFHI